MIKKKIIKKVITPALPPTEKKSKRGGLGKVREESSLEEQEQLYI